MSDTTRQRRQVDAPELGASVWLVEATVGEFLPIWTRAESGNITDVFLAALAASLEVDGQRYTEQELHNFPARKARALMRLGTEALRINGVIPETENTEGAEEKKAKPKKSTA